MPFAILIIVAASYLLARGRPVLRLIVFALLAWSFVTTGKALRKEFQETYPTPTVSEYEFAAWLSQQQPPPVFMATRPLEFGAITRGFFHEVSCTESAVQIAKYFHLKLVDHVVTFGDEDCPFFLGVRNRLDEVRTFGTGPDSLTVWRYRQDP